MIFAFVTADSTIRRGSDGGETACIFISIGPRADQSLVCKCNGWQETRGQQPGKTAGFVNRSVETSLSPLFHRAFKSSRIERRRVEALASWRIILYAFETKSLSPFIPILHRWEGGIHPGRALSYKFLGVISQPAAIPHCRLPLFKL